MTRSLILTASLILTGAVAVSAQHPQSHPQGRPHDASGHTAMDPAQHAALHGLMHGDWHGTLRTSGGASSVVDLNVAVDDAGKLTFKMTGDRSVPMGASTQFTIDRPSLRWTQDVSGQPCQVDAKVVAATSKDPETLTGKMSCADGERTFTLRKNER